MQAYLICIYIVYRPSLRHSSGCLQQKEEKPLLNLKHAVSDAPIIPADLTCASQTQRHLQHRNSIITLDLHDALLVLSLICLGPSHPSQSECCHHIDSGLSHAVLPGLHLPHLPPSPISTPSYSI